MALIIDGRFSDGSVVIEELDSYNRTIEYSFIEDSENWFGFSKEFDQDGRIVSSTHRYIAKWNGKETVRTRTYIYEYNLDGSGRTVKCEKSKKIIGEFGPIRQDINITWTHEILVDGEFVEDEEIDS